MLNPESIDCVVIDGSLVSVESAELSLIFGADDDVYGNVDYEGTVSLGEWDMTEARVGTYTAGFLGGADVQAAAARIGYVSTIQRMNSDGDIFYEPEHLAADFEEENEMTVLPDFTSDWTTNNGTTGLMRELAWISYTPLFGGAFEDDWPDGNPFAAGVHSFAAIGAIDDPDRMGPWFVLGGSFEGSDLLPGAGGYAVDMDTLI